MYPSGIFVKLPQNPRLNYEREHKRMTKRVFRFVAGGDHAYKNF